MTRIILYTGKGGVGKTSVSAATALRGADLGYRTVVISTDAAHSLADSFDEEIGPEPTELTTNLWAQEVDVLHQMDEYWGIVQEWLSSVLTWRGMKDLVAEETSVLPGMEELASLLEITRLHDSGDYDVIIVDCAPTGETLRFLSFPEVAQWYLTRIFPIERKAAQMTRPLLRSISEVPVPEDEVFESVKELILKLNRMHDLLTEHEKSSVRLVLNPEKMVIKEAQRTFTYLNLYDFATDLVISNRVFPEEIEDAYFDSWKESQEKYGEMIEAAFSPLPILQIPLFDQEVVGFEMLRRMAESTYGDEDPTQIFYEGKTHSIEKKKNGVYRMNLRVPLTSKEELDLTHLGDELIVRVGNHKRNILLPRALWDRPVERAQFRDGNLEITFAVKKRA